LLKPSPGDFDGIGGGGLLAKDAAEVAPGAAAPAWAVGGLFAIGAMGGIFEIGALPAGGIFEMGAFDGGAGAAAVEGVAALACRFIKGAPAASSAFRFIASAILRE